MPMNVLEKVSLWGTLFVTSTVVVWIFNHNLEGAIASGVTTASIKTPFVLVHQRLWSKIKEIITKQ